MIVVSDTSPLNYLILLKKDHILPGLFGAVVVPPAVVTELARKESPEPVQAWLLAPPAWLRVQTPQQAEAALDLDPGETQAILLAEELHAERVLLDDSKARRIALARGLKVAGTLAILVEAHLRGFLDLKRTLNELRETTFYIDQHCCPVV